MLSSISDNQARCDYICWSWNSISLAQLHFPYAVSLAIIVILSVFMPTKVSQEWMVFVILQFKVFKPLLIHKGLFPNSVVRYWHQNPWILKSTDITQIHKPRSSLGFEEKYCSLFLILFIRIGILKHGRQRSLWIV